MRTLLEYLFCTMLCLGGTMLVGYGQTDSNILYYQEYVQNVLDHHPIAQNADLQLDLGVAEYMAAKGQFDPQTSAKFDQKSFDDKRYYRHFMAKVKVPTKWGLELVGGYENTDGVFLNPENKTDEFGLWNLGIEANLLQGLLIDERRTALKQAEVFQRISQNEQQKMLNDLLYKASLTYLNWQEIYAAQNIIEQSIELAETYFENTKTSFLNGEKTAIDTLEAKIVVQDRKALLQKNQLTLVKVRQQLENFLWYDGLPLELKENVRPEEYVQTIFVSEETPSINQIGEQVNQHPDLLQKRNKLNYFELEQRLKREKVKPKLKLKYNPLLATSSEGLTPNFALSNYKWGIDFSFPLFLRSERAAVQQGEIKLANLNLEIANKQNELENKIEASLKQIEILEEQLNLQTQNVAAYQRLLEAENEKFLYGESSVFLLNKRQEKFIEGSLKMIELQIKQQKLRLQYWYESGQLVGRI